MPLTQAHYTLGTATATKVVAAATQSQRVLIHNAEHAQSDEVFIGNSSVTTASGMHIHSDETLDLTLDPGTDLWAISDTDDSVIHVLRITQD